MTRMILQWANETEKKEKHDCMYHHINYVNFLLQICYTPLAIE